MRVIDKITDVAIPVALTLALIVGLLWEHDTQLEHEEEEWDRFFQGRKLRAHANKERLLAELDTAQKNARTQQEAVTFLQQQKKDIKSNISEAVEALEVAREDLKGVAQDAIARDRSKATVDKKLFACDEDHDRTMTKLKVLGKEAQGLHLELEVLDKRKFKLTEKLNQGFGVRTGKKSDVLLVHDNHVEEKLLAAAAANIHNKKNQQVQQATDAAAHQRGEGGEDQQNDHHEGHPHQHDAGDGVDDTEAAAEDVTTENKKDEEVKKVKVKASPEEIEADATNQKAVWEKKNYPPDEEVNKAYAHHHKNNKREEKEVEEDVEGDNHRQAGGGGDEVDAAAVHNKKAVDRPTQNDLDAEG